MFAGPGSGKSTIAAGVFHVLKTRGVVCEYAPEYAKDLCWEERSVALGNQPLILGKQFNRLWRLIGKVEVVITDAPLLLAITYNNGKLKALDALALELHNSFDNMNYFISRVKKYSTAGRNQTELEARVLDVAVEKMLMDNGIPHLDVAGNKWGLKSIVSDVMEALDK